MIVSVQICSTNAARWAVETMGSQQEQEEAHPAKMQLRFQMAGFVASDWISIDPPASLNQQSEQHERRHDQRFLELLPSRETGSANTDGALQENLTAVPLCVLIAPLLQGGVNDIPAHASPVALVVQPITQVSPVVWTKAHIIADCVCCRSRMQLVCNCAMHWTTAAWGIGHHQESQRWWQQTKVGT
jgi:hypothetical protein